jgi:hypothetical protein
MSDLFSETYLRAMREAEVRNAQSEAAVEEKALKERTIETFFNVTGSSIETFNAIIDEQRQARLVAQVLTRDRQNGTSAFTDLAGLLDRKSLETLFIVLPKGDVVPSIRLSPNVRTISDTKWDFYLQSLDDSGVNGTHTLDLSQSITEPKLVAPAGRKRSTHSAKLEDRVRDYCGIAISGNPFRKSIARRHMIGTHEQLATLTASARVNLEAMQKGAVTWTQIVNAARNPELNPAIAEAATEARLLFEERATQNELDNLQALKENPRDITNRSDFYLPGKEDVSYLAL